MPLKEESRREITKEEYESRLIDFLEYQEGQLKKLEEEYETNIAVYKKYLRDKRNFRIEYYQEGVEITYERFPRRKVGF